MTIALLPPNAGPIERALTHAASDALPVPIEQIMDAATTPAEFLPWLAAHENVRLWYSDWPDSRKREIIADWLRLAGLIGTRAAASAFLAYVDGELVHRLSYPAPFVMGRAVIGRTPIGLPSFVSRYLVKVPSFKPPRAFVMGRSVIGRARLKTPSREPFSRALNAVRMAKAPETEVRVDFAHMRVIRLSDNISIDGTHTLGGYVDRKHI